MKSYHLAWLSAHPNRSEDWLQSKLKEGFDVHHIDGNHSNDDPLNLVLIEHSDHMMLHGGRMLGRIKAKSKRGPKPRRLTKAKVDKILMDWRLTRAYCS